MPSRRAVLAGAAATALLAGGAHAEPDPPRPPMRQAALAAALKRPDTLAGRAAARGILFGSEASRGVLSGDIPYAALLPQEAALMVTGIEFMPARMRPAPGRFDFTGPDWMAGYAANHGIAFRGHPLVWHYSQADWLPRVTRDEARGLLVEHVDTVCRRYAGAMHSWDVVNEPVELDDHRREGLRASPWYDLLGPRYLDIAFETARAADPAALLVLNETDLEMVGADSDERRAAVLALLARLRAEKVPVDALGIQSHLRTGGGYRFVPAVFAEFLRRVAGLGYEIVLSEMDVVDRDLPADRERRDRLVAELMTQYLGVALAQPAVRTVVVWGLTDRHSWLSVLPEVRRRDGLPARGSPLDDRLQRKPVYDAIGAAFDAAPNR